MTPLTDLAATYVRDRYARREIGKDRRRQLDLWLGTFTASFGARPLDQLGVRAVERWMETIAHLRPSSRRIALGCVDQFCRWLVREGDLRANPCDQIQRPKVPRTSPRVCSVDEQSALTVVLPDRRAVVIVGLMLGMGLRRGEVSRLGVGDFDPVSKTLRVVGGKTGDERTLPVPDDVSRAIHDYLTEVGWLTGPLVRSTTQPWRGLGPGTIGDLVSRWMRDAGVKVRGGDGMSAHTLRRTCGTELYEVTGDVRVPQEVLGHRSSAVTMAHYVARVQNDRIRDAMGRRAA